MRRLPLVRRYPTTPITRRAVINGKVAFDIPTWEEAVRRLNVVLATDHQERHAHEAIGKAFIERLNKIDDHTLRASMAYRALGKRAGVLLNAIPTRGASQRSTQDPSATTKGEPIMGAGNTQGGVTNGDKVVEALALKSDSPDHAAQQICDVLGLDPEGMWEDPDA